MDLQGYKDEICFKLTGGILDLELDNKALDSVINASFREIQRYIDTTVLKTVPYNSCIDMTPLNVSSVVRIYRAEGYIGESNRSGDGSKVVDPLYASQWQLMSGVGNLDGFQDAAYNYMAWNTLLQTRNTASTDLAFRFDKHANKLYINIATNYPQDITIEYVPRYNDVSEITSDYWIDMIIRLAVATAKVILGRIRSRYTQTNALWQQDGDSILAEGNAELTDLREKLLASTQLCYPID